MCLVKADRPDVGVQGGQRLRQQLLPLAGIRFGAGAVQPGRNACGQAGHGSVVGSLDGVPELFKKAGLHLLFPFCRPNSEVIYVTCCSRAAMAASAALRRAVRESRS